MGMGEEYIKSDIASLPDLYDKEGVEVKQGFAKSRDGTKVPYFIVTPKCMSDKGDTPTLLYGYGGENRRNVESGGVYRFQPRFFTLAFGPS